MRRLQLFNWFLIAVNVGLAYRLVATWWPGEETTMSGDRAGGKSIRFDLPHAARRPPPKELAATIGDKDLFDESRSASLPSATASGEEARPLNVTLIGVMAHGGERVALVSEQGQPKPIWLREGEDVGGNTLESIGPYSVVFSTAAGEKVTVELKVQESKQAAARTRGRGAATKPRPTPRRGGRADEIKAKIQRLRQEARARREARLKAARGRR